MAQRPKRRQSNPFSTINPHAAGIDIGATHHVVAVGPDRDPTPVRTFCTFSGDLHALADWLHIRESRPRLRVARHTRAFSSRRCAGDRGSESQYLCSP